MATEKKKRKHVRTGRKPPGGRRPGAGRPKGAKAVLRHGEVAALRALRHRVPDDCPDPLADVAGEALETIVDVMRGRIYHKEGRVRLKAATEVREEVCGPKRQRVEVDVGMSLEALVTESMRDGGDE